MVFFGGVLLICFSFFFFFAMPAQRRSRSLIQSQSQQRTKRALRKASRLQRSDAKLSALNKRTKKKKGKNNKKKKHIKASEGSSQRGALEAGKLQQTRQQSSFVILRIVKEKKMRQNVLSPVLAQLALLASLAVLRPFQRQEQRTHSGAVFKYGWNVRCFFLH